MGQDLNNLAPRFGLAYAPFASKRLVIRGGLWCVFRPALGCVHQHDLQQLSLLAGRGSHVSRQPGAPHDRLVAAGPHFPFNQYLPNRIVRTAGANGTYQIRDGTKVTLGADGTPNPIDPATGSPTLGNIAETFEFRAVDRDLRTPYVQQWNFGTQYELSQGPAPGGPVRREQGHQAAPGRLIHAGVRPEQSCGAGCDFRALQQRLRGSGKPQRSPEQRRHGARARRGEGVRVF